jgi:hypothetical protein
MTLVPVKGAPEKALHNLSGLMNEISGCRRELGRRESVVSGFERQLQADLRPMEAKMVEIRIDTLRILGRHLKAGWLGKRAREALESALYDLANELESEYDADLRDDRLRIFGEDFPVAMEDDDGVGNGADPDADRSFYREADFTRASEKGSDEGGGQGGRAGFRAGPGAKAEGRDEGSSAGDIRALYLMLARALHPDKEPDASRREEKTSWMQKVVAAYESRDLARLLDILSANPLDAVGPYLSQAPLKTVQGYAKRLRRELETLRARLASLDARLDPFLASFIREGKVNEAAYKRHLAEVRKELKFMKERRDAYRTSQGLKQLIEALGTYDWRELM